jgi:spermidine/putrescine transport system permease protein
MRESGRSLPAAILTILVLLFLHVPLAIVVLFSFHETPSLTLPFRGVSLRWYREVLGSSEFTAALLNSVVVALAVALVTLVLGTMTAYGLSKSTSRLRAPITFFFLMPLALPGLFLGIALLVFVAQIGLGLSLLTVFIAHFVLAFPFFFILARIALDRMDRSLEDAAAVLGASPFQVFRRVTLPQIWPVLAAATALTFVVSFDEFIVTFFVVGGESTLPIYVFGRLRRTVDPTINVISTLLLLNVLLVLLVAFLATVRSARRRGRLAITVEGSR